MNTEVLGPERSNSSVARTQRSVLFRPLVDIYEQDDAVIVVADVPGATAEDISLNYENSALTLEARVQPRQQSGIKYLLQEYGLGDFRRVFEIFEEVDSENIKAECSDGVLRITLPKAPSARPKKISVKQG